MNKLYKLLCLMLCLTFSTAMMAQMEPFVNFTKVSVSNLSQMKAALESNQNTCITLTKDIAPSDPNVRASELRGFSYAKSDTIDCSYWAEIPFGYFKYLDLNGKKFWVKMKEAKLEHACMIYNTGNLTITDNSAGRNGEIRFDDYMFDEPRFIPVRNIIYTTANSTVTINGGKLIAGRLKEDWWFTAGVWKNLSEYIYQKQTKYDLSERQEAASEGNFPTFTRLIGGSCVVSAGGTVIVNDGDLTAHGGQFGPELYRQSKIHAPGGCISFDHRNAPYFPNVIINGGEMHADAGARVIAAYTNDVKTVSDNTFINRGRFYYDYSEKGKPILWVKAHYMGVYPYRFIELRGFTGIPFPSVKGILSDAFRPSYEPSDEQIYVQMNPNKNEGYFSVRADKQESFSLKHITIENGKIVGEIKIEQLDTARSSVYTMPSAAGVINSGIRVYRHYNVYVESHLFTNFYAYLDLNEGDDLVKELNKLIDEHISKDVMDKEWVNDYMFNLRICRYETIVDAMGNPVLDKVYKDQVYKISARVGLVANSGHEHSYTSGQVILKKPSCTEVGKKQVFCGCGEYIEQEIAMTPHNYSDYYFYTDKSCWKECLECGKEYVPELSDGQIYKKTHMWSTVLIKQGKYKCTRCGYNRDSCHPDEIDKQGDMARDEEHHWWNCPTHFDEADCPNHLMLDFSPHEHFEVDADDYKERLAFLGTGWDYVPGDCQNGWYCKNSECNAFYHKGEVPHVMVKVSETESTCAKQGEIVYKCDYDGKYNLNNNQIHCSEKKVVKKDPVMHDFEHRSDLSSEPTCTVDGKNVSVCKVCGQRSEIAVPAPGHELEFFKEVQATCQNEGSKAHYVCNHCGEKMLTENGSAVTDDALVIPMDENNHVSILCDFVDKASHDNFCVRCGKHFGESKSHQIEKDPDGYIFCTMCHAHFASINTSDGEGYATYIGDFDAEIPEGTEFYTVSKVDANDCVVLVKVDYVTAGVPYLVYNRNKAQVDIAGRQGVNKNIESDEEAQYVFTEGVLTGYLKVTATNAGIYMLKTVDGVPGFYKTNMSGFADASTCSLSYFGASPVVYIISPDGVNAVKLDADKAQHIYDVLGRQLSAPQKGVNIVNGKKVLK